MSEEIYQVGFKKMKCGKKIPMYSNDPEWILLRDNLRKKVDKIAEQLKQEKFNELEGEGGRT
jgi:transcription initiation factor IIE alpha subunit